MSIRRLEKNCGRNNNDSQQILIIDTGADQSICGGPSCIVRDSTGDFIQCNIHLKGKEGTDGPVLPVVNVSTCVEINGEEPLIFTLNQACCYTYNEQDEILCLSFKVMEHNVTFDLTPKE